MKNSEKLIFTRPASSYATITEPFSSYLLQLKNDVSSLQQPHQFPHAEQATRDYVLKDIAP